MSVQLPRIIVVGAGFGGLEAVRALRRAAADITVIDPRLLTTTSLRYPFDQQSKLTDGFGYRSAPVAGFHNAQDFDAGNGALIRTMGDGIVGKMTFNDWRGFGLQGQQKVAGDEVKSRGTTHQPAA